MRTLILASVAFLSAACTESFEGWKFYCDDDEPTVVREFCWVTYTRLSNRILLAVGATLPGEPYIFAYGDFCVTPRTEIWVDQNTPITLIQDGKEHYVPEPNAAGLLGQFKEGSKVVVRVQMQPGCQPRDVDIPLRGFAEMWRRYRYKARLN